MANNMEIDVKDIASSAYYILRECVGSDYASRLIYDYDESAYLTDFMWEVKKDVEETSAWKDEGYYTDDDIRLAIGRVIMWKFDIKY